MTAVTTCNSGRNAMLQHELTTAGFILSSDETVKQGQEPPPRRKGRDWRKMRSWGRLGLNDSSPAALYP